MNRVIVFAFLPALLAVTACGDAPERQAPGIVLPMWARRVPEPCAEDRRETLGHIRKAILDETAGPYRFGFLPLRAAERRVASQDAQVRLLDDRAGRRRLTEADVVLLSDRHSSLELAGVRHRLILQLLQDSWARPSEVALIVECVPLEADAQLQRALASSGTDGGHALRALLRKVWSWPVEPHVDLLCDMSALGVRVLAAGTYPDHTWDHDAADEDRRPIEDSRSGPEAYAAWREAFNADNRQAAALAREWIRGGRHRKAVIEFGLLHHFFEKDAIAASLKRSGLDVLIEVGFVQEIETALLNRFGPSACSSWVDLGDGLIRCPYVRVSEVAREGW